MEAIYAHYPGLIVMTPATVEDAYSMLLEAVAIDDPVIFCEHKNLYAHECDVPEGPYTIPFGEASISRDGKHCTIVTYGLMVHRALDAATKLAKEGIEVEIVDLRTLSPLDMDTVLDSVTKTGRLVCVDEASPRCNIATDISAQVAMHAFGALKAQIEMVSPPHSPVPFSPTLEDLYIPSADQIASAVRKTMKGAK